MKKAFCLVTVLALLAGTAAEAQYGGYGRFRPRPRRDRQEEYFKPVWHVNLGYGFPNLDRYEFSGFYGVDQGTPSQTGPFMGSVDYQFNPRMSIGVLATHGTVSAPYYSFNNNSNTPDFTGHLNNTAIMLDLVRYLPAGPAVTPYFRTAIGVNIWQQDYTDGSGNQVAEGSDPSALAYQVSFGAKFHLSKQAGLFLEAGYGKYIVAGGLAFSFK
ncbi:MAG TPA: outer membrane beta-barrel protein [Chitinophagaceae bacterium]|jgi:hypothetical protein